MNNFSIKNIPDLDTAVLAALELIKEGIPKLNIKTSKRPLVVGSGNAAITGKILFENSDAIFADESNYLKKTRFADSAIIISASGSKHSVEISKNLKKLNPILLTCNENAPSKEYVKEIHLFPKNREPYSYNVSTYLSMIFAKTQEDPKEVFNFIKTKIDPFLINFKKFDSFYLIIPKEFELVREMALTKFDELFGSIISARVFTEEQTKHAKTIVNSKKELFISFGYNNTTYGINKLNLPIPSNTDYATIVSIIYYIIGKIQKQNKPYFKNNILEYTKQSSKIFKQNINPIVE